MGAITAFAKAAQNIKSRRGSVLVAVAGSTLSTGTKYSLGIVRDTSVKISPVKTSRDNTGREHMLGADLEVTFTLLQTDYSTELTNIDGLLDPAANGLYAIITDTPTAATTDLTGTEGIQFDNATMTSEGDIVFNGDESFLTFSFMGRVSVTQLASLGTLVIDLDPS